MKREYVVILVTAESGREAEKITKRLLKEKCAACINIIHRVNSHFLWKGKIEKANESLLIIKTKKSYLKKVIKLVKKIHSYEIPEIVALPVVGGNKNYLNWIEKEV